MENFLIHFLSFFWFVRTIKFVLFWIFLWQLKEYHIGRFIDHFRTYKGKKLIFNLLFFLKIVLLPLIITRPLLFTWALLAVYIAESFMFGFYIIKGKIKKPKFTFKTIFLLGVSAVVVGVFLLLNYQWQTDSNRIINLLLFDILTPVIISLIVLLFQPFFVIARNRILKKAKHKMTDYENLKVIAITGSYGKTSTKEFLTTILSAKFNVLSTPDHKNSEVGISQTILESLNSKHEIFIVEMGAYAKGGINLLCDIVRPDIGIVTGVNEQHLATFGSLKNLLSAEGGVELVKNLPRNGLIILNGDNKYCVDLYRQIYSLVGGGLDKKIYTLKKDKLDADIWTEDLVVEKEQISFVARTKEKELTHFNVNVLGKQNIQNMLGVILVAKELGMNFQEISWACSKITQQQAGMTIATGIHNIHIIDSSYSANPDGVMADLDYLSIFRKKKVVVMPCLIELGKKSKEIHYNIGKKIAQICDLAIITTRDQFENIKKGAVSGEMLEEEIIFCEKPQEIFNHITTFCKEGDAVLLEGGRPKELIKLLSK